ncbi:MAG TPA: hypothetical protein VGQ36_28285 [Thermoanaerobaculia bacterium]|jgi:superfamily I DNA and RNA helicase|nr:hypothetical protein [Thermoanaerobaculia bacterium]
MLGIYVVFAVGLAVRRSWKELSATFRRLQQEIERLEENAKSHLGDLETEKRRYREINAEHRRQHQIDMRDVEYQRRKTINRLLLDVEARDLWLRELDETKQRQAVELTCEIQRLNALLAGDKPPDNES